MPAKSPYNFVPAPEWKDVFKPDWAGDVSHDLPFSDGESGEIEIEIVAETPIFIRSGKEGKKEVQQFPTYTRDGATTPYIPGTSIKGMIRNVMEIISKSMLNPRLVSNDKFSFRNLNDARYRNIFQQNRIKAGWLTEDKITGEWTIETVNFCKVKHTEIQTPNDGAFSDILGLNYQPRYKNAKYKYNIYTNNREVKFNVTHAEYGDIGHPDIDGRLSGVYVFTGQPSRSNPARPPSKIHEYIFYKSTGPVNKLKLSNIFKKEFLFTNDEFNNKSENPLRFWKEELAKGKKMPVFYLTDNKNTFMFFGMAKMFRYPYKHSIHQFYPISSYPAVIKDSRFEKNHIDLTHAIFGYTSENESLKGRVFFSHAICEKHNRYPDSPVRIVLGSPKASYFPHYLKNDYSNNALYDHDQSRLSGFKRYFVREKEETHPIGEQNNDNDEVFVKFNPIGKDSIFKGYIRYHNLRKAELGALFSALTFHGNDNLAFHQIGGAKSYGFGKIKLSIKNKECKYDKVDEYLKAFERTMYDSDHQKKDHFNSASIKSLFSLSSGKNQIAQELKFPTLQEHNQRSSWLSYPNVPNNILVNRFYHEFEKDIENEKNKKQFERSIESLDISKLHSYINDNEDVGYHKEASEILKKWILTYYNDHLNKESINDLEKYINDYPYADNIKEAESQLVYIRNQRQNSKLRDTNELIINCDCQTFRKFKDIPNEILRKNKSYQFNERQKNEITSCLISIIQNDRSEFMTGKGPKKINEFPWTDIQKWIGQAAAQELHNNLFG